MIISPFTWYLSRGSLNLALAPLSTQDVHRKSFLPDFLYIFYDYPQLPQKVQFVPEWRGSLPFRKGVPRSGGVCFEQSYLIKPQMFFYRELFNRNIPPAPLLRDAFRYGLKSELLDAPLPCVPKGEADASHIFHLLVVIADNHSKIDTNEIYITWITVNCTWINVN